MFAGHYGVSFAVKSAERRLPLWLLFLAVQFVDVLWGVFVPLGIEKVRIVPGITASNLLDLYYMPYTHSLVAALAWSGFAFLCAKVFGSASLRAGRSALFLALAVLSHWLLDLLVHRPDLPLYDDANKVGLGLWNFPAPALLLEAAVLFGGMGLYLRSTLFLDSLLGARSVQELPCLQGVKDRRAWRPTRANGWRGPCHSWRGRRASCAITRWS